MSELGSEESTAEQRRNKEGTDLKILTPNQMLSRLPIYLFRSKKLTKQIYNSLIDII